MFYNKVKVESIKQCIEDSLKANGVLVSVGIENNYRCISVSNDDCSLSIWIRLILADSEKYLIDFSSVCFPDEIRRKGVFTGLVNSILKNENIKSIAITSVCTEEMKNWCEKNNFIVKNGYDYYSV